MCRAYTVCDKKIDHSSNGIYKRSSLYPHANFFSQMETPQPKAHDCNECKNCQRSFRYNSCATCQFLFFEKLNKDCSTGNQAIDEIIKHPIHRPERNEFYYYEWGGFGVVYKAIWADGIINLNSVKHHGEISYARVGPMVVAIKFMSNSKNSDDFFREIYIERSIIANPVSNGYPGYIAQIIGITQNPETLDYGFVMEFAEYGDLRHYLSSNFLSLRWSEKLKMARDIAWGLITIHESGMVHRDLHSGNILQLSRHWTIIGDLGLSQPADEESAKKGIFGVIPYVPPEILRGENYETAGDIYSFGMILWELAMGKPPFHDRPHDLTLLMDILNGLKPDISVDIPTAFADLIKLCLDKNPSNRPTAKEIRSKVEKIRYLYDDKITNEGLQLSEKDKIVKQIGEKDKLSKPESNLHPKAIYSSRLLTSLIIDLSKAELTYLSEVDFYHKVKPFVSRDPIEPNQIEPNFLKRYIKLCMYDNSALQLTKMNPLSASSDVTEDSKSEITEFDDPNSPNINISGKRSFQSEVWDYFDKFEWTKGKKTAKCTGSKCVHKPFSCGITGTTKPLWRHLKAFY
ncbi:hypothetical protein G9A89_001578 [Geosiphon pyriformis]|nr:hypothetical protein G9A89_001578 [Geosiphon pyriformis]